MSLPQETSRASTEEPIWSAAEGRWQNQHPSSSLCQEVAPITSVHIPLARAGHLFMPNFNKEGNTTNLGLGRKKTGLQVNSPNDHLVLLPEKPALCPVLGWEPWMLRWQGGPWWSRRQGIKKKTQALSSGIPELLPLSCSLCLDLSSRPLGAQLEFFCRSQAKSYILRDLSVAFPPTTLQRPSLTLLTLSIIGKPSFPS